MPTCCWSRSNGAVYIRLEGSDGSDSEEELLESVEVDGTRVALSDSSDEELTQEGLSYTESAYRGVVSSRDAVGLASLGYGVLRVCDYAQLYLIAQSRPYQSLSRERRSFGGGSRFNSYNTCLRRKSYV